MALMPPIPPQEGLHPLIVHFPIGLLLTVPLFIIAAALWKSKTREVFLGATALVVLGTLGAFAATMTGEWGEGAAKGIPGADAILDRHESLGETARNAFVGASVAMLVLSAVVWRKHDKLKGVVRVLGAVVILALYAVPCVVLAKAAHEGARLVHEAGVRAPLTAQGAARFLDAPAAGERDD